MFVMAGDGGLRSCSIPHSAQDSPIAEDYPAPNVNGAVVEKPCFRGVHYVIMLCDKNRKKSYSSRLGKSYNITHVQPNYKITTGVHLLFFSLIL